MADAAVLTTGWEPDLPAGDTLVRAYLLHWAELCEAVCAAGGGRAVRTPDLALADLGRPSGYFNAATLLRPPADWDALLGDVEAFFGATGGEAMLWSAWPTPDLRARGWRLAGHPPLLARPPVAVAGLPAGGTAGVRPAATAGDLAAWERVVVDGYPLPELQPAVPGALMAPALLGDDRLRFWLAGPDGSPEAAAASFVAAGLGSLALGVTLPAGRRQGHWRRLAVARLEAMPELWVAGVFSDDSRPGAERLGFVPLLRLTLWARGRSLPLRPTGKDLP